MKITGTYYHGIIMRAYAKGGKKASDTAGGQEKIDSANDKNWKRVQELVNGRTGSIPGKIPLEITVQLCLEGGYKDHAA